MSGAVAAGAAVGLGASALGVGTAGAITAGVGAAGVASSVSSSKAASKAASKQAAVAAQAGEYQYALGLEQLELQKSQIDKWEKVFGPVLDNLSTYYKNLTPNSVASKFVQQIETNYSATRKELDRALAQRGITSSGSAAAAHTQLLSAKAADKATARAMAPEVVREQQSAFLGLGLGQQGALQAGLASAYSNLINTQGLRAATALGMQQMYSQQSAAASQNIGGILGQAANTYMTYNALNPAQQSVTWINPATAGGTGGIYGLDYR